MTPQGGEGSFAYNVAIRATTGRGPVRLDDDLPLLSSRPCNPAWDHVEQSHSWWLLMVRSAHRLPGCKWRQARSTVTVELAAQNLDCWYTRHLTELDGSAGLLPR